MHGFLACEFQTGGIDPLESRNDFFLGSHEAKLYQQRRDRPIFGVAPFE